jgi:hypothetical protein
MAQASLCLLFALALVTALAFAAANDFDPDVWERGLPSHYPQPARCLLSALARESRLGKHEALDFK